MARNIGIRACKEELEELFGEGRTKKEIARILKVSYSTVKKWFKKFGIVSQRRTIPSKEELVKVYWEQKFTIRQVAKHFRASTRSVEKWFRNYGIPRRSLRESHLGCVITDAQKRKISESEKQLFIEGKRKPPMSNPIVRRKMALTRKKQCATPEGKQIIGRLKQWYLTASAQKKEERLRKALKALSKKPNKSELWLSNFLDENFPHQWKFVGDGQLIIDGRCPDFINVDGKKQIIELFGEPWHKNDNPEDRKNHFGRYGFSCLVIWSRELKSPESLREKIESWMKGGE